MPLPAIAVAIPRRHAADHARTMAFSGEAAQANGRRRDVAPQSNLMLQAADSSVAMLAMPSPPIMAMTRFLLASSHRHTARLTELRIFRVHAGRDFRNVRNEVGAQPHRVRCARLLGFRIALSIGAIEAPEKRANQHHTANKSYGPHSWVPRSSDDFA